MYCDISEGRRWSEKKVKESKYMNEVIIVKYIYTSEEVGGEQRSEVVRESPYSVMELQETRVGDIINDRSRVRHVEPSVT